MSELDNPQPNREEKTGSEETNQKEENMDAEITDHERLKHELRLFLELYTTEKIRLHWMQSKHLIGINTWTNIISGVPKG